MTELLEVMKEILFSSRYDVIKLLLATAGFFSQNLQSLPATNKKKLARHEIYTGGVRQQVR